MKIEQLLVQYLYNSKKVTLQEIGRFYLSQDVVIPADQDKDFVIPENAVRFEYDKKATQDDDLIDYIVSQTRKIKPLATSDLESYSLLAKQFLNIGKPFPIEGLGVLQKTQNGDCEFIQGAEIHAKLATHTTMRPREKEEGEISFASPERLKKRISLTGIFLILFIIAIGTAVFFYLRNESKFNQSVLDSPPVKDSSSLIEYKKADSAVQHADSLPVILPAIMPTGFRIVLWEYSNKDLAESKMMKISSYGHRLEIISQDTSLYKIAMPFSLPAADTTRIIDSLNIFFGVKSYVAKP